MAQGCNVRLEDYSAHFNTNPMWPKFQSDTDVCMKARTQYRPPNNIPGVKPSTEKSAAACQARCRATLGCEYFSWFPLTFKQKPGTCELTNAKAKPLTSNAWYIKPATGGPSFAYSP